MYELLTESVKLRTMREKNWLLLTTKFWHGFLHGNTNLSNTDFYWRRLYFERSVRNLTPNVRNCYKRVRLMASGPNACSTGPEFDMLAMSHMVKSYEQELCKEDDKTDISKQMYVEKSVNGSYHKV